MHLNENEKISFWCFVFTPCFVTKGSVEKKFPQHFRFDPRFVTKGSVEELRSHSAKCIAKRCQIRRWLSKSLSRCLDLEGLLSCTLTIEHHPTAYAPGEVRDDMSVPMVAIRRQPPVGRVGCSAFPIRTLLPLFQKPLERT